MDREELIAELARLAEATKGTNQEAMAVILALKAALLVKSEALLLDQLRPFVSMQLQFLATERIRREQSGN